MPRRFSATRQGWCNTSSFSTLPCSVQQTHLLPHLNWTFLKWRWCRSWFQKQGWRGRQLRLSVAVSKMNGVQITPCSLIEWEHPSVQVNLVLFSASICTDTWQFCSWEQGPFESNNPFVPCYERNLRLGRCGYSRVYLRSLHNRCFFFLVSCSVPQEKSIWWKYLKIP